MDRTLKENLSPTLSACRNLKGLLGGSDKDPIPRGTSDYLSDNRRSGRKTKGNENKRTWNLKDLK
jgi:hypothetical protein